MEIQFKNEQLAKVFNNDKEAKRVHGVERAKKLRRRLDDLTAAENLAVMRSLPGRCHELKGELAGSLALDLDHPFRLIFESADEPVPKKSDGGLDWTKVRRITILEVRDYHG